MTLLSNHLEQISLTCQGIDSLPFPPPKIFTNALLSTPDITSLIRDTEAHERALFSVPPPAPTAAPTPTATEPDTTGTKRRQTVFNVAGGEITTGAPSSRPTRRHTAVSAVLGGDLHAQIARRGGREEIDVEVLLRGAEMLCGVYALPGALEERIPSLRMRHQQQSSTLAYYEARVAEQTQRLEGLNRDWMGEEEDIPEEEQEEEAGGADEMMTEADLRREEEEVRELERRKRELQEKLRATEKDLSGLLNL